MRSVLAGFTLLAIATCAGIPVLRGAGHSNLAGVEKVMGQLPSIDHNAPLNIHVVEETNLERYTRKKIIFSAEPNSIVHAWLLTPHNARRAAAALCLHQTTAVGKDEPAGISGKPNLFYAQELASRGYVALVPDYPSFGEDKTDFQRDVYARGYKSGSMKGIVNHIRSIDVLLSLPEVDKHRIAVVGHSLGGHNALFVAAFDTRIRAVVTSCGFTAMSRYYGGNLKGWSSDRYMPLISTVYHNSPRELPFDFSDILDAISPRAVFINAPLHDSNFDVAGVDETVAKVERHFPPGKLVVVHPDSAHDFPPAVREQAYQFLDEQLK